MFKQAELQYDFDALEPYIDTMTMQIHYGKHHGGYTANFNKALEQLPELEGKSAEQILIDLDQIQDPSLKTAVRNNGGGFFNHNLYFGILGPQGGNEPAGPLAERISEDFGNFQELQSKLTAAALGVFGSGWAWLSRDKQGKLLVSSTPNQDNPLMTHKGELTPILGIDVWEHAYYLKYQNVRPEYVQAIFKVIDWKKVAQLYQSR